jgi:Family of unknown function (DUF5372)
LCGREFALIERRVNWGEDRVYYHDEGGRVAALPARWTSVCPADPVVAISLGRSAFRVGDLVELAALIERLRAPGSPS